MILVLQTICFSLFLTLSKNAIANELSELHLSLKSPIATLRAHDDKVRELLEDQGDSLKIVVRDSVKLRINSIFDFKELSRLALGNHWESITQQEKERFTDIFGSIIREQNFDTFLNYYRESKLNYDEENIEGKTAIVNASVPLKRGSVSIAYSMHVVNQKWRIYDVAVDSVSTAEGNRRRYERYIKKHSYEKLILQLEKQLARLETNGK